MNEQPKYRMLEVGEIIQEGDEFHLLGLNWGKVAHLIGAKIGHCDAGEFRRPIAPESPELPNGWLSMDSAPKNGTEISVWTQRGRYDVAKWDSQKYNKNPKPYWHRWNGFGVIECRENPPIAWQPLPKGPTE